MRILFLGDYSNLHACLAKELRSRGHEVTLISDKGGYMQTSADIHLERKKGVFGGFRYLYDMFKLLPDLKDYDVVQLINPNFLKLKPGKIKYFFDRIKGENRSIYLTLAGNDYYFVKACAEGKMFRFSEFKIGSEPTEFHKDTPQRMYGWINYANRNWSEYLYERLDGAMSVLPEYDMAAKEILQDRLTFTNLPIDLSSLPFTSIETNGPVRMLIGMRGGMEIQKGTKKLLTIAKDLEKDFPDRFEVEAVRNLSLTEYLEKMKNSHIVLDQLYSYSPATNALQAMAMGKIAASGGQPEYYEYIGNPDIRPIFSLSPFDTDIRERLYSLSENKEEMKRLGQAGRNLVERHNDVKIVADRFLSVWDKKYSHGNG